MAEENPPQGANPEQTNSSAEHQQILDDLTLLNQQGGGNLDVDEQANLGGTDAEDDPTPGLSMQTIHQGSTTTTEQLVGNLPLQGEILTTPAGVTPGDGGADDLDIPPIEANSFTPDSSGSSNAPPEGGFFTADNNTGGTPGVPGGAGAPGAGPNGSPAENTLVFSVVLSGSAASAVSSRRTPVSTAKPPEVSLGSSEVGMIVKIGTSAGLLLTLVA